MATSHAQAKLNLPNVRDYVASPLSPFPLTMGLRSLDLADWIEVDKLIPAQLAEKRRLLAARHQEVFAALPQAEPGSQETLELLVSHLLTHYPQIYEQTETDFINKATGEAWNLAHSKLHPLELAGRLVQEDLCLMGRDRATGEYRLTGACLCFPTRWRLSEKVGKSLDAIHGPIPGYAGHLATPVNRLFERLKTNKAVWRLNWSVLDDPALFQPGGHSNTDYETGVTSENAGDLLWLRMERQTLRRLPQSQDILFTIRVYNHPLSILADRPEQAANLALALKGLDEPMRVYKSMPPIIEAAVAWLERAANT